MKIITLLIVTMLAACTSEPPPEPSVETKPKNMLEILRNDYANKYSLLSAYISQFDCESAEALSIIKEIDYLQHLHSVYHQRLRFKDQSVLDKQQLVRRQFTELGFDFAQSAMQKKCYEQAQMTYQKLFNFYQNTHFNNFRQQALDGLNKAKLRLNV